MRPAWLILAAAAVGGCGLGVQKDSERETNDSTTEWTAREKKRYGTDLPPHARVTPTPSPSPSPEPSLEPEPTPEPTPEPEPESDPGPPPAADCGLEINEDGFFERELLDGTRYVGFLPPGYSGEPTRLFVGLHGCGDDAGNFAEWAVNPEATRSEQKHIGISVEDSSGGGCWSEDEIPLVLQAIADVSRCVYVHQKKISVGGYSSGGVLAYRIGLSDAFRFAGILVENSTISRASGEDELMDGASWHLPIAHIAHTDDGSYPIDTVREDWERLREAGFPLETNELDGDHDGTTEDWLWLLPKMAEWESP